MENSVKLSMDCPDKQGGIIELRLGIEVRLKSDTRLSVKLG
jgi:hypothetical protein